MKVNASVAAKEVRFHSLFETTPELIVYQDKEGFILDVNPAFVRLVGETKEQLLNRPYYELLPPEIQPFFKEKLAEAFTGKVVRFDMFAAQGNSPTRHWDVVKVPLMENGVVVGVHMIARDITDRTLIQQQLFSQNRDLQDFTYIVSHNLRAPLTNALGLVSMLGTEERGSPIFAATWAHLQTSLHQLDHVVQDMNTILAIRDQQDLLKPTAVLLAEVVQQVILSLQELLTQCGGTVRVSIPDHLEVLGNRNYLSSTFFRLLSNAIKYRADNRPLEVDVKATHQVGQRPVITVTVTDNGSGFDMKQAGTDVFKIYKRFHPTRPGRGVGLYLVKAQVESMGGHIEVSSQLNKGTTFLLSF